MGSAGFLLIRADVSIKTNTEFTIRHYYLGWSAHLIHGGRLTASGHSHHERAVLCSYWNKDFPLDTGLPSLHAVFLPKHSSEWALIRMDKMDKNALSIIMVFHSALLLIKGFSSWQKCSNGFMVIKFIVLIVFPFGKTALCVQSFHPYSVIWEWALGLECFLTKQ